MVYYLQPTPLSLTSLEKHHDSLFDASFSQSDFLNVIKNFKNPGELSDD
jgi:hypothetical protein